MRIAKNWYIKKLSKDHVKVSSTNYEIPNLAFFLNIRSKKKKKLFYLTHFLIKLSYKYSLRMVCLFLLKRSLNISLYKYGLSWKKHNSSGLNYNNIYSLLFKKLHFRNKVIFKLKRKLFFYYSFFFYYYILYTSYFFNLINYLKNLSIINIFIFYYIYNKKKYKIPIFYNTLFFKNKKKVRFILSNKSNLFNNILIILKNKKMVKKELLLIYKLFLLKKKKHKLIINSLILFFNKNDIIFNYTHTSKIVSKIDLHFKNMIGKENKRISYLYIIPNNKILHLISVFLKKHMFLYNDSVIKSYNWFNFVSFSKLKLKKSYFDYIKKFKYFMKNKFRRVYYRSRKKFYRFLHNWVRNNGSLLPSYRRAKLFAHFKGHLYVMKNLFLSPLSFHNQFGSFLRKKHLSKVFWAAQNRIRYKLISILGKKQLLKELSHPIGLEQWFKLFLKHHYNMTMNSFLFFSKNLEYKTKYYKIKDILILIDYKFNIFINKYFSCNMNSIEKIYTSNCFNKNNNSNTLLNIGDILFFKNKTFVNYERYFIFLNFLFFIDPIKFKIKENILLYLYNFIYNSLFLNLTSVDYFFNITNTNYQNINNHNLYHYYLYNYFTIIKKNIYSFYKYIKSISFFYYKYDFFNKLNSKVSQYHNKSKYIKLNFLNKIDLISISFFDNFYTKYNFVTFKKKIKTFNYFDKKNTIKNYILTKKYWKFRKWKSYYFPLIKNSLNQNKISRLFFFDIKKTIIFLDELDILILKTKENILKTLYFLKIKIVFLKENLKKIISEVHISKTPHIFHLISIKNIY